MIGQLIPRRQRYVDCSNPQWCGGHIVDQKWLDRENTRRGIAV